jgi:RNA polymerase sigma-70 factor (ECF subfamily)
LPDDVKELVRRSLGGDPAAMTALVEQFSGLVYGLCFRMLRHRQDAEDVAQESFSRMFRSLGSWDSSRDFKPWLLAITGNRCRTLLESRKRRPAGLEQPDQVAGKPSTDHSDARYLAEEVWRAVDGLREEYRQAFLLFHEQELSYQEISEVLACPLGTVKTWVHRARREVATVLRKRGVVDEVRVDR